MWSTPAPPSTALVAAAIWSGTGEVKIAPAHAASSMPLPTNPPCRGSWPDPPPDTRPTLPDTGASARITSWFSMSTRTRPACAVAMPASASGTTVSGSLMNFLTTAACVLIPGSLPGLWSHAVDPSGSTMPNDFQDNNAWAALVSSGSIGADPGAVHHALIDIPGQRPPHHVVERAVLQAELAGGPRAVVGVAVQERRHHLPAQPRPPAPHPRGGRNRVAGGQGEGPGQVQRSPLDAGHPGQRRHGLLRRHGDAREQVSAAGHAAGLGKQVALAAVVGVDQAEARAYERAQLPVGVVEDQPGGAARAARPLHRRWVHAHELDLVPGGLAHRRDLGVVLGALVLRQEPAAVGRVLGGDDAGFLADHRRRRRVHDPAHDRARAGADHVLGAGHVRGPHRPRVAHAEAVHAGGVVDDLAPARGRFDRLGGEHVAGDDLRAERLQGRGRLGAARERAHVAAVGEQPSGDPAADEAGGAGDEDAAHGSDAAPVNEPEKRTRYSTAEATVISAAISIATSSRRHEPMSTAGWTIASRMATNWVFVFSFPQMDGFITMPSAATRPRRPMITSSRPMMIVATQAEALPTDTSATSVPDVSSLSAVVSRNDPSVVSIRQRRARYPSRVSVTAARTKRAPAA